MGEPLFFTWKYENNNGKVLIKLIGDFLHDTARYLFATASLSKCNNRK